MKKKVFIVVALLTLGLMSPVHSEDSPNPHPTDDSCPVKTVYVNVPTPGPTVYVDKPVPGPTVYVNVPGPTVNVPVPGPTVYVDKPVIETQTVPGQVTQVQVQVENPINTSLQSQVAALKAKYAKLLRSYTLLHKHEVKEKAKYFSGNK